ncbi:putative ribonuclease H-like domain-containing protein [Tanacetum coccineum]
MKPFGCPVTILNTIDHLGKFDGKAAKGFFVGYSTNIKAFRVFNSRTRIIEENLHVKFSEDTPNIVGSGPNWLFDIDALTNLKNYKPVVAGNQANGNAGTKACDDTCKTRMETEKKDAKDPGNKDSKISSINEPRINQEKDANVNSTNNINNVSLTVKAAGTENNVVDENIIYGCVDDPNMPKLEEIGIFSNAEDDNSWADMNNLDTYFQVSLVPTTRIHKYYLIKQINGDLNSAPQTRRMIKNLEKHSLFSSVLQRTNHKDFQNCLFSCFLSQEEPKNVVQALKDPSWIEAMQEELLQFKLQEVWTLVELPNGKELLGLNGIEAIRLFLAYASFKDFMVYQMDLNSAFLYGKIEEEVYVCQPSGFEDPDFPDRVYKVEKALYELHQAPRACQDKYVNEILNKFGFSDVKTASTPMETHKTLLKDVDGEDIDEHLYRSMIGSLMYLTSSRPKIMFAVCAYARFQVNLKISHLHAVKRIFRYLKGQLKLGLWYPKDSPFDLVAYTDKCLNLEDIVKGEGNWSHMAADYTTNDYLNEMKKLLMMKFKKRESQKQIERIVSKKNSEKSKTDRENCESKWYFDAGKAAWNGIGVNAVYTSCIEQFWATAKSKTVNEERQLQALVDKKKIVITESIIRRDLHLEDAEAPEEMGEGSEIPTDPQHIPTTTQPSTSQPQKKQKPKRKQRKGTEIPSSSGEPIADEAANEEHVPTHSNDPLLSGEDILKLNELMELCTNLSQRVLNLEKTKTSQAAEIPELNERVKKLEKKGGLRTHKLKRLYKVGRSPRVVSSKDEGQDMAEKEVDMAEKDVSTADLVTNASEVVTIANVEIPDELTLAQTLIEIKSAKPKVVTTAATTVTPVSTRPRAKGIIFHDQEEQAHASTPIVSPSQSSQIKDKGKGIMVEEPKKMQKKDQLLFDKQEALRLHAQFDEEDRIAREKEEANAALIAQ